MKRVQLTGVLTILTIGIVFIYVFHPLSLRKADTKSRVVLDILSDSLTYASILGNTSKDFLDKPNSVNLTDLLRLKYGPIQYSGILAMDTKLTVVEERRYWTCFRNADDDRNNKGGKFWEVQELRRKHHDYLKRNDSVMIELGGNIGADSTSFVELYNPRYIILEPLEAYYNNLTQMFKNNPKVTVLNLGLGKQNEVIFVNVEGSNACATSKFSAASGKTPLFLANATAFFLKLGVGLFDVDLLTMNCEGCEYDVLETLVTSSLVTHFRNIQWGTHSTLPGIDRPYERYCRTQQLLARTHRPTYQYNWIWESWRRNDIK